MEVHEFDRGAWMSFAGCERWQGENGEGTEPLIGEGVFESGERFCLVLDSTGACLMIEDDPQCQFGGYCLSLPFPTQDAARTFAKGIGEPNGRQIFFMLGFEEI